MAEEDFPKISEDDDLARARTFWKENGKPIIFGISLGLIGIVGFNYWQKYQQQQAENASTLYDQILPGADAISALTVADELKESFPGSVYTSLGAFSLAKIFVEEGKLDVAATELQWVVDNSKDAGIRHVARIRLCSLYLAEQKIDQVIELINSAEPGVFESRYQELLGDAYALRMAEGDAEKAREAYQASIDTLPASSAQSGLLQLKMDNLGDS